MIVSFTGTRFGLSYDQWASLCSYMERERKYITLALHGGCLGADEEFHQLCETFAIPVEIYPGYATRSPSDLFYRAHHLRASVIHGALPHFTRNRILVQRADRVIACPFLSDYKGGTWYTYRQALKAKKGTFLIERARRRFLFLDFDGVLNIYREGKFLAFQKSCIIALNYLISHARPDIIITSDWRKEYSLEQLGRQLHHVGVIRLPCDVTPVDRTRNDEIRAYLNRHTCHRHVILEDEESLTLPYVIRTSLETGLTMEEAYRAVQIFIS